MSKANEVERIAISSAAEARKHIGKRLFWVDECSRWRIERSGILTSVYHGQLELDNQQDYKPVRDFKDLSVIV